VGWKDEAVSRLEGWTDELSKASFSSDLHDVLYFSNPVNNLFIAVGLIRRPFNLVSCSKHSIFAAP